MNVITPEDHKLADGQSDGKTRLSIFGLGYVGAVSSACFADLGHKVIGVDPAKKKVEAINRGAAPIVEPGLGGLLVNGADSGLIRATTDVEYAIHNSDLSFVCVGTPSAEDGSCDLKYLREVSKQIGEALKTKDGYHVVVFRSTVPPGTTMDALMPIIEEASGKTCGEGFGVGFHPEFLRESSAIADFHEPPKTVVGAVNECSARVVGDLYNGIDDAVIYTTIEAAEMVKYVDNTWHALKVSFANEVGKIAQAMEVDSHEVMRIFAKDTKLNLSPYYLKPGFAFGGSCLPKDVRGINCLAEKLGVSTPVLGSIISSNEDQIAHAIQRIEKTGCKQLAFLGVTFKAGTDDLRESPVLPVIGAFVERGYEVSIFDPNLNLEESVRHHLQHSKHSDDAVGRLMVKLPHLICSTIDEALENAGAIVVSHNDEVFREAVANRRGFQYVVDLVRLFNAGGETDEIRAAGMNAHLQKPARRDDIVQVLGEVAGCEAGRPQKILLAEDNRANRHVIKGMLEKVGWTVDLAVDGKAAVEAVGKKAYDAVLMDLRMPNLDGYQAAHTIRAMASANGKVPIVALSAHADPETARTYGGICW